jgi:hypothetical protein
MEPKEDTQELAACLPQGSHEQDSPIADLPLLLGEHGAGTPKTLTPAGF